MNTHPLSAQEIEIREQQRASWNTFSVGWRKWDELFMRFMNPVATQMVEAVKWRDDFKVLDLAAGTGEPGLSAALQVPRGKVIATDVAEEMLIVAQDKARLRTLSNFETRVCGVEALPFEDGAFDVALCRFGLMFFPNIGAAAREILRVLAPDGTLSVAVWSTPPHNSWATTVMGTIAKHVELPPPVPGAVGLFRCANIEQLTEELKQAGFRDVSAQELTWEPAFGTPETYWTSMTEVAAPVVAGLARADSQTRERIRNAVLEAAAAQLREGEVRLSAGAWTIVARK